MLIVNERDIELTWPEWGYGPLLYEGCPFTGMVISFTSFVNYKEGVKHGVQKGYHINSQLSGHWIWEHGKLVSINTWSDNGQLRESNADGVHKEWTLDGVLTRADGEYYFPDGSIFMIWGNETLDGKTILARNYFSNKGELLFKCYLPEPEVWYHNWISIYYDEALMNNYFDSMGRRFPNDNSVNRNHDEYLESVIMEWIWKIYDNDKKQFFKILNHLMTHSQLHVIDLMARIIVNHSFYDLIEPENDANKETWARIREQQKRGKLPF